MPAFPLAGRSAGLRRLSARSNAPSNAVRSIKRPSRKYSTERADLFIHHFFEPLDRLDLRLNLRLNLADPHVGVQVFLHGGWAAGQDDKGGGFPNHRVLQYALLY